MESLEGRVIDLSVFGVLNFGDSDDDSIDKVDALFAFVFHIGAVVNILEHSEGSQVGVDQFFNERDAFLFELAKEGEEPHPLFFFNRVLKVTRVAILPEVLDEVDVVLELLFGVRVGFVFGRSAVEEIFFRDGGFVFGL